VQGTKLAMQRIAAETRAAFLIGLDWHDDIGNTNELELMDEAHRLGLSYQHWALTGDGTLVGNNILDRFDWSRNLSSITENGRLISEKLIAQTR
jgi:hypothetical protein